MKKPMPVPSQTYELCQYRELWKNEGVCRLYLASKLPVHLDIAIGTIEGLLEEGKQDRDDDDGLESLSEDDEEDGDRKDVDSHDDGDILRIKESRRGESPAQMGEGGTTRRKATRCGNGLHLILFGVCVGA